MVQSSMVWPEVEMCQNMWDSSICKHYQHREQRLICSYYVIHSIYVQLIDIIMIFQTLHTEPVTEQNLSNVLSWLKRLETTVFVPSSRCDVRVFKKTKQNKKQALAPVLLRWLEEKHAAKWIKMSLSLSRCVFKNASFKKPQNTFK